MDERQHTDYIASRARIIYIGIPLVATALFLIIGSSLTRSMADEFAKRLAQQYAIEAAANFQISVNQHFVLMQQVARSTTISRWMANEDDEEYRASAFTEIRGYHIFSPNTRLMFTTAANGFGYDLRADQTLEEFLPWGQLAYFANPSPQTRLESQWFFNTRDATRPFIMNVQRERPALVDEEIVMFIWSNHRMYYEEEFVGAVTVGFPFDEVYQAVFGDYNTDFMRGYLIDGYGLVRVDSAGLLELHVDGLPTPKPLPEAVDNPQLAAHIDAHLTLMEEGIFQHGEHPHQAIHLEEGPYRYASIVPIMGSAWSVVVLSNYDAFYGGRYVPLIVISFSVLILAILLGNYLVRKGVLEPLSKLTTSAAKAADLSAAIDLFGLERNDEIGELARTVQLMRESLDSAVQSAKAASDAKSAFLSTISHEIRTPMNSIMGMSAIGKETKNLERKDYALEKINVASIYLLGIINDTLDMSKIEVGQLSLAIEPFQLEDLFEKVKTVNHSRLQEKRQHLIVDISEQMPKILLGDEQRLAQILTNLVSNAIKFAPKGSIIQMKAFAALQEEERCQVEFSVIDEGIGIPFDQQDKVFTAFFQAEDNIRSQSGGTGLGLSISKNLVELMGGTIWVQSVPHRGSTFSFSVSLLISREKVKEDVGVLSSKQKLDFTGKTVLLVDDIEVNREIVAAMLEGTGIHVVSAENGAEALKQYEAFPNGFDLIFMDVLMPVMDGYEATRKIRLSGMPGADHIPIVAMTANAFKEDELKCLAAGMTTHLGKPLDQKAIIALLQNYLGGKR